MRIEPLALSAATTTIAKGADDPGGWNRKGGLQKNDRLAAQDMAPIVMDGVIVVLVERVDV